MKSGIPSCLTIPLQHFESSSVMIFEFTWIITHTTQIPFLILLHSHSSRATVRDKGVFSYSFISPDLLLFVMTVLTDSIETVYFMSSPIEHIDLFGQTARYADFLFHCFFINSEHGGQIPWDNTFSSSWRVTPIRLANSSSRASRGFSWDSSQAQIVCNSCRSTFKRLSNCQ